MVPIRFKAAACVIAVNPSKTLHSNDAAMDLRCDFIGFPGYLLLHSCDLRVYGDEGVPVGVADSTDRRLPLRHCGSMQCTTRSARINKW